MASEKHRGHKFVELSEVYKTKKEGWRARGEIREKRVVPIDQTGYLVTQNADIRQQR